MRSATEHAVIAGHDWGAPVAWHAALLRPDRFRAVIGLSVPFRPRGSVRPTTVMPQTEDAVCYQLYFQEPGVAEAEYDPNARRATSASACVLIRAMSGAGHPRPFGIVPRQGGLAARMATAFVNPPPLPAWLSGADVDFYTAEFTRTGFRGGLNWYRNIDRNWELMAPFDGLPITVPALFMAGERDPVMKFPGHGETRRRA